MKPPNFCLITLVLLSVNFLGCNGATWGQACNDTIDCTGTYQYCDTTCKCNTGYTRSGSNCLAEIGLRENCSGGGICAGDNTQCNGQTCQCTSEYYEKNSVCVIKIAYLGNCLPGDVCAGENTVCNSTTCQCKSGYSRKNDACVNNIAYGDNCSGGGVCTGDNTVCIGGTCQCSSGYNWDNSACVANKIAYGSDCLQGDTCDGDNTECSGGTCQCKSEFYRNNNACVDKLSLYDTCPPAFESKPIPCKNKNAICKDRREEIKCRCGPGFYDNSGVCTRKVTVGQTCPSNVTPQTLPCLDSNAICSSSTSICECKDGFFNDNGECKSKVTVGQTCPSNVTPQTLPCLDSNAICSSSTSICECKDGFFNDNGECKSKIAVGGSCLGNLGSTLPCNDSNAECTNSTCKCTSDYYNKEGVCTSKIAVGGSCPSTVESTVPCKDPNADCTSSSNTCECKRDFYLKDGVCTSQVDLGETCSSNAACKGGNTKCSTSGKCVCDTGYYDNTGTSDVGGTCVQKVALGAVCPNPSTGVSITDPCNDVYSTCQNDGTGYKCGCTSDYYDNNGNSNPGGQCVIKVGLGSNCPMADACKNTNSQCVSSTCVCISTYYDTNTANVPLGDCKIRKSLNTQCTERNWANYNTDQCSDQFATCISGSCTCKIEYYQDDSSCVAKISTGLSCPSNLGPAVPCSDSNARCTSTGTDYKCTCISGYYNKAGVCSLKISTGSSCPSNFPSSSVPCSDTNARCTYTNNGYKCTCISGYYNKNGVCSPKEQLGASCTLTTDCADVNAECSSQKCTCKSGYYDDTGTSDTSGTCIEKVQLGAQCPPPTNDVPNTATCLDDIATCISDGSNYKCLCPSNYYDSNGVNTGSGECLPKKQLGENCQYNRECRDSNAECSSTCVCKSGYYDNNGGLNIGGTCIGKIDLGAQCPNPSSGVTITEPCNDVNSTCQDDGNGYKCRCTSNYYDDNGNSNTGGQCVYKVELGYVCPMADACIKSNSQCVSRTCVCISSYYDTNTDSVSGGDCKIRKSLNTPCTVTDWNNNNTDQCSDQFATCINGYCTCNMGYHEEGSSCVANKANGESCIGDTIGECSDPNSECRSSKCTCKISYYDDNGFDEGGKCQPVSELQVGSVTFNNIQTTSINVSWSHPPGVLSQFVNYYTVRWKVINAVNYDSSLDLLPSTSTYTVTDITPGKTYKVEILSYNTKTESNISRTATVTEQQAAKPNKVQKITSSDDDLDVGINGLTIRYTPGTGGRSGFNVRLFDGETKIAEKNPGQGTTTSITMYNSNLPDNYGDLKNGYNYTVKIKTMSESFGNNNEKIESDVFEAIMKTTPKTPNPPVNGQCDNVLDNAITVSWNPPSVPNGYIIRYHVRVYKSSSSLLFTRSTVNDVTSLKVDGLEPGTSYYFEVITENEVGNSSNTSSWISSGCKTKAKMADPPKSLLISNTSSRGFTVTWDRPVDLHSEENFGYVLQIKDDTDTCVTRVLYNCSNCNLGLFDFSSLPNPCTGVSQATEMRTKDQLEQPFSYTAVLKPAILYTVTVSAINGAGQGHIAVANKTTLEEAPQKPRLSTSGITSQNVTLDWKIDGPRPGVTTFVIKVVTNQPATPVEETIQGFDKRTFEVTGLEEYWDYNISVVAKTLVGSVESNIVTIQTLPAAPGKVSEFTVDPHPGGNYTLIKVSWKIPSEIDRNSEIERYEFQHNVTSTDMSRTINQEVSNDHTYQQILSVVPETYYQFKVSAVNTDNETGQVSMQNIMAPPGKPINIEITRQIEIIPKKEVSKVEQTRLTLNIERAFFQQTAFGKIQDDGLIVCKAVECDLPDDMELSYFKNTIKTWKTSAKGVLPYRPTKPGWIDEMSNKRRKRSIDDEDLEYTVGSEDCSQYSDDTFCNGPLEAETKYYMVAVVCTNGGCTLSKSYGPFVTAAVPPEGSILWIIGVVVGVVVLLIIVAVVVLVVLRRRKGPKQMDPAPRDEKINIPDLDPATSSIQRKRPILLDDMAAYVQNMHKDSNLLFAREYEDLKTLSPKHPCEAADREENRLKNRYINIIPFDHSRVKLSCMDEDDSSDYINANYLPGYTYKREYIACQGPIPGTIDDFWKMVWEQHVSVVVMLTLCKEGQKVKCEQYWPDVIGEPKQYGDVVVEVTSCSTINTYHFRTFKMNKGNETRIMKQFHFLSWLDFQANVSHDTILDFIEQVRNHVQPPDTSGPIIVHCSAGVGRTGTYICLDHLKQLINDSDFNVEIDIFDMVLNLRNNRQHMVQTEQQYIFIHDAVLELLERKRRANNIYENTGFSNDDEENIYQNQENEMYANVSASNVQKTVL